MVQFDQNRVGGLLVDGAFEALDVGDEQIVADELHAVADALAEQRPAGPVIFVQAIFERNQGVFAGDVGPVIDHLGAGQGTTFALEDIFAVDIQFGAGRVHGEHHVCAGFVASALDGFEDDFDGGFVGGQAGRKATFITDVSALATIVEHFFEGVVNFGTPAQRLAEATSADGHNHEFLEVGAVFGMLATVEDVHHRHRQHMRKRAADVAVQRHVVGVGGGTGHGQRHAEDGIGAEVLFGIAAIEDNHGAIDGDLVGGIFASQGSGDFGVDIVDGRQYPFAEVMFFVAVA